MTYTEIREYLRENPRDIQAMRDHRDELDRLDDAAFRVYADCVGLEYAYETFDDAYQGQWDTKKEFAEHLYDEGCMGQCDASLEPYIDFDYMARDLFTDDYMLLREDDFSEGYVFRRI